MNQRAAGGTPGRTGRPQSMRRAGKRAPWRVMDRVSAALPGLSVFSTRPAHDAPESAHDDIPDARWTPGCDKAQSAKLLGATQRLRACSPWTVHRGQLGNRIPGASGWETTTMSAFPHSLMESVGPQTLLLPLCFLDPLVSGFVPRHRISASQS